MGPGHLICSADMVPFFNIITAILLISMLNAKQTWLVLERFTHLCQPANTKLWEQHTAAMAPFGLNTFWGVFSASSKRGDKLEHLEY